MTIFLSILSVILTGVIFFLLRLLLSEREYHKQSKKKIINTLNEKNEAQEHEVKLLLNAFDDALLIIDNKGIIHVTNKAATQQSKGRKLRGKPIGEIFLNELITRKIKKAISLKTPTRTTILLPNNTFGLQNEYAETAWILDIAPLDSQTEESLHRVIFRDITAEHRTDQIKKEFIANASHELRTPLAIINGYIENLLDDEILAEPVLAKRFLNTMKKHGDRLADIIEDMLSVSKLESGETGQLHITTFPLNQVLADVKDRLHSLTVEKGSSISIQMDTNECYLRADRFYWEQILFNLTENALKQNSHQTIAVNLTTKSTADYFEIRVTDNGKGIPAAHLPYIFNRFYRVEKHHSQTNLKGTGLGLSIVKHAVESHNGSIEVQSSPGDYTHFIIRLPLSVISDSMETEE